MLETITIFDDDEVADKTQSHRVTDIKEAARDHNRVNVYIDDKYYCSLDISQVVDLGIKIGRKLNSEQLEDIKRASEFGKFYARALEYVLMRPHSIKEISDYLRRKTLSKKIRTKNPKTGEYKDTVRSGYDPSLIPLVLERLDQHGHLDDRRFAELWVENRDIKKGTSFKKLRDELARKGISQKIIDDVLHSNMRNEREELRKVIARKSNRYTDRQKLIQYLIRRGFAYSDILDELSSSEGA